MRNVNAHEPQLWYATAFRPPTAVREKVEVDQVAFWLDGPRSRRNKKPPRDDTYSSFAEEVGKALGNRLADVSFDSPYRVPRQLLAHRALEQIDRGLVAFDGIGNDRPRKVDIVALGEPLATPKAHQLMIPVAFADDTRGVAKIIVGAERLGEARAHLAMWGARAQLVEPLAVGSGEASDGRVLRPFTVLVTRYTPGMTFRRESGAAWLKLGPGGKEIFIADTVREGVEMHQLGVTVPERFRLPWAQYVKRDLALARLSARNHGLSVASNLDQLTDMASDMPSRNTLIHLGFGVSNILFADVRPAEGKSRFTRYTGLGGAVHAPLETMLARIAVEMADPTEIGQCMLLIEDTAADFGVELRPEVLRAATAVLALIESRHHLAFVARRTQKDRIGLSQATRQAVTKRLRVEADPVVRQTALSASLWRIAKWGSQDPATYEAEVSKAAKTARGLIDFANGVGVTLEGGGGRTRRGGNPEILRLPSGATSRFRDHLAEWTDLQPVLQALSDRQLTTTPPLAAGAIGISERRAQRRQVDHELRAAGFPRHPPGSGAPSDQKYVLSVLMATAREGDHLLGALRSLDAQGDTLPEHIALNAVIVPDGNATHVAGVVGQFRAEAAHTEVSLLDPWLVDKQAGVAMSRYLALMRGARRAQLVMTLDDDDQLAPGSLAYRLAPFFVLPALGYTTAQLAEWFPSRPSKFEVNYSDRIGPHFPGGFVMPADSRRLMATHGVFPAWPQTVIVRADIARRAFQPPSPVGEDMMFLQRITLELSGVHVPIVGVHLNKETGGITRGNADWPQLMRANEDLLRAAQDSAGVDPANFGPLHLAAARAVDDGNGLGF